MTNCDKKISEAVNLYNSITTTKKIKNYKNIYFNDLDSLAKMNLATSFEEVLSKKGIEISFGNNEDDFAKIFKDYKSLTKHVKKCLTK